MKINERFQGAKRSQAEKNKNKKAALNFNLSSFWASKAFRSGRRMEAT